MTHPTIHASSPDYWMVYMASAIGMFLHEDAPRSALERDYEEFLEMAPLEDEARAYLPTRKREPELFAITRKPRNGKVT